MKNLRSLDASANDFLRGLSRLGDLRRRSIPIEQKSIHLGLERKSLRIIWGDLNELPGNMPFALIGSKDLLSELFPKLLSLPGVATPITALMRSWQVDDFDSGASLSKKALGRAATLGYVGLIIAELNATIGPDVDLKIMGMDGVRRTLSFVFAQAAVSGWTQESIATIMRRWLEVRMLTENEDFVSALIPIAEFGGFLLSMRDHNIAEEIGEVLAIEIHKWVESLRVTGTMRMPFNTLVQNFHDISRAKNREDRYDIIANTMRRLENTEDSLHPLEQGFLLSLIEPGSFDFLDLARRSGSNSGAIAAAYCMCTSILGGDSTLGDFNAFGWNVINSSSRFEAELNFDISIAELRVLHDARRSTPMTFRTRSPSLIDVELAPMVVGSFGNAARRRLAAPRAEEDAAEIERLEMLQISITDALNALEIANNLIQGKKSKQVRKNSPQRNLYK